MKDDVWLLILSAICVLGFNYTDDEVAQLVLGFGSMVFIAT